VYFAVADADATAAKVTAQGGSILAEPFDTPVGRIAVARDPQGAVFSFMTPAPQPS
jgi:predicted enzyme related to lactoylglutathione lyase